MVRVTLEITGSACLAVIAVVSVLYAISAML